MTDEKLKYAIAVMQAARDGEEIQVKFNGRGDGWVTASDPSFNWHECDYRVKPLPRRFWLHQNVSGTVACGGHSEALHMKEKYGGEVIAVTEDL